ncbi:dTDP-4-dehydrorhamnose 3,5-epimerase [Devosia sp. Leaf64]|uniref:dTDP-4-dehydrorhamnose 3,5-epimerase n=1 Tax=Devosia sp. Leaf64 TaxID=1736229 RepID=UPI0007142A19|nr:dTDP-4-dehydrorhamnose 3,5-epimerase [Devosia sp. Leaf64]KQN75247.1 dTDP-4-dehydrorhamnose 3,5-epimerase [Devosia sp. Leaf64]
MLFVRLKVPGPILITPKKLGDLRGWFMESFRASVFEAEVGQYTFVQENSSMSTEAGTVRGLHFQLEPKAQGKLVSCTSGALLDVAVDIRSGSPTFGEFVAEELSAENGRQLWVPPGFAHGFCTLQPNTVISYKVTDYYSAEHDRGLAWDDPDVNIKWPVLSGDAILSDKDRKQPTLANLGQAFRYETT